MGVNQRTLDGRVGSLWWGRDDWDVLVVMDATRVDLAREVLAEPVKSVWSPASTSIDWINRTFNQHPEHAARAGYVTANPFADHDTPGTKSADLADGDLGHFRPLYKTHWQDITAENIARERHAETGRAAVGSGIATVPPDPVTDHGIAAWRQREQLDIDRLVLHYMQPHEPYRSHPEWGSGDSDLLRNLVDPKAEAGSSVWPQVQAGRIPEDELWAAGVDNLHWVLEDVCNRLLSNVDGRVVLTADHGNAMGEWGEWHHPPGALSPACRKVPWLGVDATDERTARPDIDVTADAPIQTTDADTARQLEALGYR